MIREISEAIYESIVSMMDTHSTRNCDLGPENFSNEIILRDHPFKTSACLRGGGVSPCADGQKVTVHKDQKSPS